MYLFVNTNQGKINYDLNFLYNTGPTMCWQLHCEIITISLTMIEDLSKMLPSLETVNFMGVFSFHSHLSKQACNHWNIDKQQTDIS